MSDFGRAFGRMFIVVVGQFFERGSLIDRSVQKLHSCPHCFRVSGALSMSNTMFNASMFVHITGSSRSCKKM